MDSHLGPWSLVELRLLNEAGGMDILMTEEISPTAKLTANTLREGGVKVHCCRTNLDSFACQALLDGQCPLDQFPIDAVISVHPASVEVATFQSNAKSHAYLEDEGIVCAVRRHIPLVAVCDTGDPYGGPFDPWIDATCSHEEVAELVKAIANSPSDSYSQVATTALEQALDTYGLDRGRNQATVKRAEGKLDVKVKVPESASTATREGCAVKVLGALNSFDPWISTVNIRFDVPNSSEQFA
ncbi:MAG TPA: hypothetical protein VMU77_00635 [Acidimicrobiales bacterium]|nr:hypothetical protein [Acidimicrobiales bacterium]